MNTNNKKLLEDGLDQLDLKLSPTVVENLLSYIELLIKWNSAYNLTAIRDPKSIIIRHLLDSLAITPFINGPNILDFGSGAGLPGIPLALALPEYDFTLLDSSNKKTTFLKHVVLSLGLKNIKVVTKRIEQFHFEPLFATIVTRATAKAGTIIDLVSHLSKGSGQILIMKGKPSLEELGSIKKPFEIEEIQVPYLDEERSIIKILN